MHIAVLVLRNSMRNPIRTVLTILGIAVGVIAYGFLQVVLTAYFIGVEGASPNRLVARHRVSLFNLLPISQKQKIEQVPGVNQVSYGIWFGGYYQDPQKFFGQFAVDPGYIDLYPEFVVPAGQKAAYDEDLMAAIIGRKLADRFGWEMGDRVTLQSTIFTGDWDFIIRGIYEGKFDSTDETAMFFHWKRIDERFREVGQNSQIGWWLIGVDDPAQNGRISDEIDGTFLNSSYPTLTETEAAFQQSFVSMMGTIITIIRLASWIVIGIILLVMANTMMMSARERITEYGVMKTLGFRAFHLVGLIGGEALLVSFLGAVVGCALTYGLVAVMGRGIEMELGSIFPVFRLTPPTVVQAIGLAMAAGLVACLVPIMRSVRLPIADALRRVA